jgi:hypothetical protein
VTPHERLERSTWDLFWLPDGVDVVDRPELMALRSPRRTYYLNNVHRVRAPASRIPALVDEVSQWHGTGLSRWLVPDTIDVRPLEAAVERAGYRVSHEHHARVIPVDRYRPREHSDVAVRRVVDESTLRDAWRVHESAFGVDGDYRDEDVAVELAKCAAPDARVQRFVAYRGDEPVSAAGLNLYPELEIGLMWGGGTVPHARGMGAYSAVVRARIETAAARGLRFVGLYARVDTSSPIVAAQGFADVGRMTYWVRG